MPRGKRGPELVATVGTLQCEPGAVNVIPGVVSLTLDIRSPDDPQRETLLNHSTGAGHAHCRTARRGF